MKIKTDNKWYPLIFGYQLSRVELDQINRNGIDYIDKIYFVYGGKTYCLDEFLPMTPLSWDKYFSDWTTDGIFIKFPTKQQCTPDASDDWVKVGVYY